MTLPATQSIVENASVYKLENANTRIVTTSPLCVHFMQFVQRIWLTIPRSFIFHFVLCASICVWGVYEIVSFICGLNVGYVLN
jgi:hypothetical protein